MKTLLLSIIYPGIKDFLDDYFASVINQTCKEFEILIIEDGISLPKIYNFDNIIIKKNPNKLTPAEIRYFAIKFAEENNFDIIIFTDADDYFSNNRVELTIEVLKNADICVNDLIPFSENICNIEEKAAFEIPSKIDLPEILNTNYFGLTNTSVKVKSFPEYFYIPSEIVAVDWWIFTLLILNKRQFSTEKKIKTYYRQHKNNIVGYSKLLTEEKARMGINIKKTHYENLLAYCNNSGIIEFNLLIEKLLSDLKELEILVENEKFLKEYISVININIENIKTGWWSEILPLNEWNIFKQQIIMDGSEAGLG